MPTAPQVRKLGSPPLSLPIRRTHIAASIVGLVLLAGCNPTKRVPTGEYLLTKNKVVLTEKSVDPAELLAIVKQKTNKRIIGMRFHLAMYNLPNPEHIARKKARKDQRIDEINESRAAKGKKPRPYKHTMGEWLRGTVGEAPVILDSAQTRRSAEQIRLYMNKEGWFDATVHDTVYYQHQRWFGGGFGKPFRQPKAVVEYRVVPGRAYTYRNIRYAVDDSTVKYYVSTIWPNSLLKTGDRFDDDILDQERTRVADHLRNEGYLFFTRELMHFDANTTVGDHQVDIVMKLERPGAKKDRGLAGTKEATIYTVKNIDIAAYRRPRNSGPLSIDTLDQGGYRFLFRDRLTYKPKAVLHAVFLNPNERFRQSNADRTYRRLTGLKVFDRVDITYDTSGTGGPGLANARISLLPGKEQSLSAEGFGTNRGGALGTSVSLSYKHRNLMRRMASLQVQFVLGLEAQRPITGGNPATEEESAGRVGYGNGLFNTVDIGPDVTLGIPLPFRNSRSSDVRALLNALYSYQRRPDYTRTSGKLSFGIQWNESRSNVIGYFPLEINVIKIPQKSTAFEDYLQQANDPVLSDSYTDHLIVGQRFSFTASPPEALRRNTFFSRVNLEWAGHPMFLPLSWIAESTQDTSGNEFNTVAGVRYAEFVKVDLDARWHRTVNDKSSFAFRAGGGIGVPYGNLTVLPFESSFFVGGANGLRAWRARSIGPGSYSAPLLAYDRTGEIRVEGNAEYRFKLIGFLEGAFFADVGNIWTIDDDPNKPGGRISSKFLSELAVGTGVGARLNFDFFVVRFDLGLQTKDPSLPAGERWLFQPKDEFEATISEQLGAPFSYTPQLNFNLGIGYPF
ncbi:MAG: BamA/TamA family outer membrane protein [Flavobacteriales bacterium]